MMLFRDKTNICIDLLRYINTFVYLKLDDNNIRHAIELWSNDLKNCNLFFGPIQCWNTSGITNMNNLFYSFNLNSSKINITNWNVSNVKNMSNMFKYSNIDDLNLSKWNTSKVEDMSGMFYYCKILSLNIENWNTENVQNMNYMFYNCEFESLDLSRWNVRNVKSMTSMFSSCSFEELKINDWNISQVKCISHMFAFIKNRKKLDLSKWNIEYNTYFDSIFLETNLDNVDISSLNDQIFEIIVQKNSIFIEYFSSDEFLN